MPPPRPTKKPPPREELAKAALVASHWAFGTKGLSEKQKAAAFRNFQYVETRLRETGGRLTDTEMGIGKRHKAARAKAATLPPPVGSPDARDRGAAAQARNIARGAAPSGGMGQTERARAVKAFTAPEKSRGEAVLRELGRQGFSPPKTEAQAQAQAKQLVRKIGGSQKVAFDQALKQPLAAKRNAKLIGEEEAKRLADFAQARQKNARFLAREAAPPPPKPPPPTWGQTAAKGLDWLVPERVERGLETGEQAAMGVAPGFLEAPMRNLKQVTADIAMSIPAIGEVTYNDLTGKTRWGLPKTLKEGLVEWGKGIERATPLPKDLYATIDHLKKGEFDQIKEEAWQDLKDMRQEWQQKPFTAALNVYPAVSGATRAAEFQGLARSIARANPGMSRAAVLRAARKESYVPGYGAARGKWKGGIPKRILEGRIIHPETGENMGAFKAPARPPSRSAVGRKIQGRYDRWSRSEGPLAPGRIPGTARFTEVRRAATSLNRKRTLEEERLRVGMLRQMAPVEKYIRQSGLANSVKNTLLGRLAENRSRLAETFYGPQGPSGIDVDETLRAVATDLKQIAEEGGQEIPTDVLGKLNKELRRVDLRLESLGPTVKFGTGLWAEAANVMRDAGYSQPQIEMNLELAAGAARAWAKREPGRDPNDWLGSPDGRNITGFEFGTPPAEALSQSLFQVLYPEDADIPEDPNNPYRINRAALAANPALELGEVPEALPFRTDIEFGAGGAEAGKVVTTHSSRHAEAQELLNEVWDFERNQPKDGADPKKVAEVEALLPEEGRTVTDRDGNEVWVGRTSLQQKDARMSRFFETLDPDQQELFRRWYERTWDYISYLYGPEKMKAMGNAFYASQAAQSPAGGIAMLFRVAEDIAAGKPMPTGKAQWLQRNVWKLMTSEDLGTNPSGLAAKLMDFFASGAGLNMRAIFGAMREFGPGVVDRWTWRSDGYITKTEKGEMMAARVPGVRASPGLGSARGKAVAYEYSNIRLQKLTDLWNAEKRFGRDDWTVDQIQAVDWFATKKEWVDNEWTPSSAEGGSPLDMAIHNTREVSFRGDPETLRRVVEDAGAGVTLFKGKRGGEGAYTSEAEGWTHAIVAGAAKSLDRLEVALGREGNAYFTKYPGQFGGTATKRSHQIDIPRARREEAAEAVRRAGYKPGDNPNILEWGEDSYRLDFGSGKRALERSKAVGQELGLPVESRMLTKRGRGVRPTVLKQRAAKAGDIRGAVQFLDTESGRQLIYLSEHANASTFAHELIGHAAHEMKREMPDEFAAVEKRYKKPLEDWGEAEHERFAREAERYLMTGKAPIPELQPVFDAMRRWMYQVYETILALGRPVKPETKALLDRYFGKEPIDFTPPQRTPKRLKGMAPGDLPAIASLIDETADLLMRGADVLRNDPARRSRIAGHMKWLEEQVLPFVDEMDDKVAARLHDLFDSYDEVRSGSSIFDPDERRLLEARGKMLNLRHAQLNKMADELRAQPDAAVLQEARDVMDDLDNAESLEDIQEAIKDLKVVSGEVGKRTRYDHETQRQLSRQVRDLERALDPNRKGSKAERDEALGVLREISEQMTDIYIDVFGEGLAPEALEMLKRSLAVRDNVLTTRLRELNLLKEGTGEGVYMPHYSIFDKLFSSIRGPVRLPAAGRTRKQLSMKVRAGQETFGKGANKLVRYGTGTVQADPRALFSAYKNRIRFLQTSMLRKQLYEIAVEIPKRPDGNPRIPEGWYIINATGNAVPKRLARLQDMSEKEIDELLASGEDFDSMLQTEKGTVEMLEEYRDSWLSKEEGGKPPPGWGSDKLRMLPPEVVETMVGKVFESTPGGAPQAIGGLLSVAGRFATIFQHALGYVQANVAANALLLALTNPTRTPRAIMEFFKTPMSLRANHAALYEDITTETGDIKAEAGLPNFYVKEQSNLERAERMATEGARKYAGFLGSISDQPFRVASWTGHARKYGFTDPEGWRELLDSTDPEVVYVRNHVSQRAREDMLDFNKLSPQEQRMARYLFIWPFVRAATAQPFWLMREYPARVTALATASRAQEEAYEDMGLESVRSRYNKVAPAEERSMFDIGQVPVAGGTINMNPVNPLGPFAEKVSEVQRLSQGDLTALGDILNPAFSSAGEAIFGNRGFDPKAFAEVTVPGYVYWRAYRDPKERGAQIYNDRDSFWDYIRRREGRFFPEDVSAEKIREKGKEEAEKLDKRPAWEKAHEEDQENVEKITKAIKKRGGNITPKQLAPIQKSISAYNALDQAEDALADKLGKPADDLTEAEKVQATEAVIKEYWPEAQLMDPGELAKLPDTARGKKPSKKGYRYALRDAIQAERSKFMSLGRDLGVVKD